MGSLLIKRGYNQSNDRFVLRWWGLFINNDDSVGNSTKGRLENGRI